MSNASETLPEILTQAVSTIQDRRHANQSNQNGANHTINDVHKWRNILSFWIMGLSNNFGFVVMLSAAFDIINRFNAVSVQ